MYNPGAIFKFLRDKQAAGQHTTLVSIIGVSGGSSRNPGAHLAVGEDGSFAGSLSGGCIEAAVVAEALQAMAEIAPREVRYGQGSPYLDIRLPCGGSIDLLFNPVSDATLGERLEKMSQERQPIRLVLPRQDGMVSVGEGEGCFSVTIGRDEITVNHIPPLRLALFGQGAAVNVARDLARTIDAEVYTATPDTEVVIQSEAVAVAASLLKTPSMPAEFRADAWTAAVLMFHDHDWEAELLRALLDGPAFFVGAMGSHKTHAARSELLRSIGVPEQAITRITAPVGLIPSMRDPETLAVSIIAQVVERYNADFLQG